MKKMNFTILTTTLLIGFVLSAPTAQANPPPKASAPKKASPPPNKPNPEPPKKQAPPPKKKKKNDDKNDDDREEQAAGVAAAKFDLNKNKLIDGDEVKAINDALAANPNSPLHYFDKNHDDKFRDKEITEIIIIQQVNK